MFVMGCGAGGGMGVSAEVGIEPRTDRPCCMGGPPQGRLWGVPPFVLRIFFCLERPWNRSCDLLLMSPAFWACHLILGSPDVSSGGREESPGEGRCVGGGPSRGRDGAQQAQRLWLQTGVQQAARGERGGRKQGSVQRPELRADWGLRDLWSERLCHSASAPLSPPGFVGPVTLLYSSSRGGRPPITTPPLTLPKVLASAGQRGLKSVGSGAEGLGASPGSIGTPAG